MNNLQMQPLAHAATDAAMETSAVEQDNHLKVLRLLEVNPQLSQRELAEALGVSLGKANYCVKALLDKGLIKMERFSKNPNKLAYAYLLTPSGVAAKTGLTVRFLARKLAEFDSLTREIELLKAEVGSVVLDALQN